ncbi:hypothetical protein EK21DRAFT_104160 [Setomelanomma holmii]|uniref:C2H2-type domain-containing protein n=1 Tax=Setomelanomma holmii TaxID=210430 RepID=A0A9P4LHF0_9PLEO|nr:hypothetical protein EK21DRAFT_104160 [Setomelanomma holmii]
MAISQRKQTNILLTFKVLQFVNQLRRRVQPRTSDGSVSFAQLGNDALGLRALKRIHNGRSRRNVKGGHHGRGRVCKSRKNKVETFYSPPKYRAPALDDSARSDASGEEMQHSMGHVMSAIASDNGLFLKHDNALIFEGYSLNQTVQLLVTVTEAMNTVAGCRTQFGDDWLVAQGLGVGLDIDENFIANYEHLLLRLQVELTQALTRKALEELLRGGHDKRQRKLLSWFSEFAEKPRPLSTSFPWTIKPSLAVLWGVCWMFYDRDSSEHDGRSDGRVRKDRVLQQLDLSRCVSVLNLADYNFGLELIGAQPQHAAQQPSQNNVTAGFDGVFQARNTDFWEPDLSPSVPAPFRLPRREDGGAISSPHYGQAPPQLPENTSIQVPQMAVKHERTSSVNSVNMPTPTSLSGPRSPLLSPTSGERPHIAASPRNHSRHGSEDHSSQDGDDDGSLRKNHSYKRAEEPPRNQEGKMICRHPDCTGLFFDRKCEWSKHMDKHDRPYKCNVKGCEKLQGFTYSGGLLRHEREVHKMHGGTKKSLFCPFHDCKRSSGAGFTRKENLAEHIRRVHRRTSMSADMHGLIIRRETMEGSPIAESRHTSESPYTRAVEYREDDDFSSLKRKRGSDSGLSERGTEDLRNEIKRLRQENEEKDSRLRQLEQAVMALQHQTRR